jgi:hypothetical protein
MNKINHPSGELTDQFLHAQADAGDRLLEDGGFHYLPTQDEMKKLALEGESLLSADDSKGNGREQQDPRNDNFDPFSIFALVAIGIAVLVFT